MKVSFDVPEYTAETDAVGTLRLLEAVRILGLEKKTKIYQASTSELFGLVQEVPQKKLHRFTHEVRMEQQNCMVIGLRKLSGVLRYVCGERIYLITSERRGENFVTRKITIAVARIAQGMQDKLYLGNLDAM